MPDSLNRPGDPGPTDAAVEALLAELAAAGITLVAEGQSLRVRAAKGALTATLRERIAAQKAALLDRLGRDAEAPGRIRPAAARPDRIPLSFAQQRLWFLDQLIGPGPTYNISSALAVEGALDRAALEAALNGLLARHEVLRTTFAAEDGVPFQRIAPALRIAVPEIDLSALPETQRDAARDAAIRDAIGQGFDLGRDPMLRATLIRLGAESFVLVLLVHHIAADGWSIGVLVDELAALYAASRDGRDAGLPPLPLQYADFALWQRAFLDGPVLATQLGFWRERLAGAPPLLQLPSDRPRPARESFRGAHARFRLDPALTAALHRLARSGQATLYTVLLAGFVALLHRYSGQEDIVVGTPIANRHRTELEPLAGFFVNTLALRAPAVTPDLPFAALVRELGAAARDAFDHQDLPFERLVEELAPERETSHAPIFQHAFALQNAPRPPLRLGELTLAPVPLDNGTSKFDLFLSMHEEAGGLEGVWEYATDLFDPESIERFTRHLRRLLEGAAADPQAPIGRLPMLEEAERRRQLEAWNAPPPQAIEPFLARFRRRVAEAGDAPALVHGAEVLGYAALDAASDRLARRLVAEGVARGALVGIGLPRGIPAFVAMLGIMKAGAAYVPLDPDYPAERLATIIADAAMPLVLTDGATLGRLPRAAGPEWRALRLDEPWPDAGDVALPAPPATEDLAYAIYTSGSTGRPKGALLTHGGLGNLAEAVARLVLPGPGDRVLQFASLGFDASVWEMVMALGAGACLEIPPMEAGRLLPDEGFAAWLGRAGITHATLPPSFLAALPAAPLPRLRALVLAGEALPQALVRRWSAPGRQVINAYGPTEGTVCATAGACDPEEPAVTIGRPIHGVAAYVVRGADQLLPVGAEGELLIGGPGVARGYKDRPELTAAAFVPNPFGPGRLYRTGDRVRYRPDGRIEFLGRIDHQAKLRGFRIEPGEVEAVIRTQAAWAQDALVMVREDAPGEKRLVAYLQPRAMPEDAGAARTEEWRALFQDVYAGSLDATDRAEDPAFNIAGWNSSYDGSPLPAAEMREWLDHTVASIRALRPRRVLEIGCGSGMVLARVAPGCDAYDATDIAEGAVRQVEALKARQPGLGHVRVRHAAADDLSAFAAGGYDCVVLNSVVQYFPGADYLRRVLAGAARLLAPGGAIFVGDVRSLPLMEALHASVQAFRADPGTTRAALRARIRRRMAEDEELYLDPGFFHAICREVPGLSHAAIALKRGAARNELSAFRYQAVLHASGGAATPGAAGTELDWERDGLNPAALAGRLAALTADGALVVRRIPNARLVAEMDLLRWLRQPERDALLATWQAPPAARGVEPEALHALAGARGLHAVLGFSEAGGPGAMDALFHRGEGASLPLPAASEAAPDWRALASNPLLGRTSQRLVPELREALRAILPDYMVPAAFVVLDRFPVTPNGKIDRAALPPPEGRAPGTEASPPAPPTSRAEEILAGIWRAVLRLEQVGVHDNFFEVGGDSILSIQVIARAREAGLPLTPRDLFQHQTIAGLARAAAQAATAAPALVPAEQGPVTGQAPLTPIQRWFLETVETDPHHFNQAMLVALRPDLDRAACAQAVAAVMAQHDALHARLLRDAEGGWVLDIPPPAAEGGPAALEWIDLPADADARAAAIEAQCAAMQAGLDPGAGRMMRVAVLDQGVARPKLLFWTVHHLVVDAVSWRILEADFTAAYRHFAAGGAAPAPLPAKTTSFKAWAEALRRHAAAPALAREAAYWRDVIDAPAGPPLPRDHAAPDAANIVASEAVVIGTLPAAATAALTAGRVHAAYRTQVTDLLLAALAQAVTGWTGGTALRLDLEGHGRQGGPEGLDLSRTVGWFTALYPVRLERPGDAAHPGALLRAVKEQLRQVPSHGLGFGVLRYLAEGEAALPAGPQAELCFNYRGQNGGAAAVAGDDLVLGVPEDQPTGPIHGPRQRRPYLLQVNAGVQEGVLRIRWHYSRALHAEATIRALSDRFLAALDALVAHCLAVPAPVPTPSDFPAATLTAAELDALAPGPEVEDIADATPLQEGMLFECLAAPGSGAYVEQVVLELAGALDVAALRAAWQALVARHPALRTGLCWEGQARVRQLIHRAAALPFAEEDWRGLDEAALRLRLDAWLEADRRAGFDLARPPLMRLALLRKAEDRWRLAWTSHHVLMDGWCIPVLFRELRALYAAAAAGGGPEAAALAPAADWRAFLRWRRTGQDPARAEAFWRATLSGIETPTRLSDAPPGGAEGGPRRCATLRVTLAPEASAALEANARAHRLTLNTLLQAAWSVLLAQETGTTEVLHGTTISGRPPEVPGVDSMVGLFINTLPVRGSIDWSRPLAEWLAARHAAQAEAEEMGFAPLRDIQRWSEVPRGAGPLFDTLLVFENYPFDEALQRADLHAEVRIAGFEAAGETSMPLTVVASAMQGRLSLRFTHDLAHFAPARVAALARRYEALLIGLAGPLERRRLGDLLPYGPAERARLLAAGLGPARRWDGPATLPEMVAAHLRQAPDAAALSTGATRIARAALDAAARGIASRLARAEGGGATAPVGLLLDRGAGFVAGLLAAWHLGRPFVPLDPRWPAARIALMAEEAGIGAILAAADTAVPPGIPCILVDGAEAEAAAAPAAVRVAADDLAYVIFTSGSTGRPKAVGVPHGALGNYVHAIAERFGLLADAAAPEAACFATTSGFAADLGYTALFAALGTGGRLLLVGEAEASDPDALARLFRADPPDWLKTVPSHLEALLAAADPAALVPRQGLVFGGEALPWALVDRVRALSPATRVFNHYGPTETTIGVIAGRLDDLPPEARRGPMAPLGAPLANARIHLVNGAMQPVPDGVAGELLIGGAQVSQGYLGRPELTDAAFLPDPFGGEGRLYCTGDRARRHADGSLEFLGRADRQLKIRGWRIEPEEIAAVLREGRPEVRECVVLGRPGPDGRARLLAWVAGEHATDPAWPEALRAWLRDRLPEPMIPAAVIPLPALPRLGNGKVDAQALPEPERAAAPAAEEGAPRNDIERRLCEVFAAVLRRPQVGVHENFFDLGGDSIVSIQIVARARAAGIAVTTRQIFAHQTVAELAFVAEETDPATAAAQGPAVGPVPLTPIQRRFLRLGLEDPHHYNQAMIFAAPAEGLRANLLEPALDAILARHDALRLRLSGTGPDARQRFASIAEAGDARGLVTIIDAAEDDAVAAEAARLQASLDPVHGPVTRLTLFRRPDGRPPLLHWVIHHLAVDGVSWRILLEDLATALGQLAAGQDAVSLPPRTLSFKAWAEALERHAASPELAAELPHWVAAGDMSGAAALPPDTGMAEEPDLVGDAGRVEAVLDAEDTAALLGPAHAAFGTQANDLLLCALARALRAETGRHAVRIDIEGHGREPPDERMDLSRTVGWFTSLAPLRLTLPEAGGWSAPDPGEDIRAVKEQLRRMPRGGGIGYGLLRYVSRAPALQDQPAAPVLFNYLGQFDGMAGGVVAGEAGIGAGPPRSPRQRRAYAVEVNALVLGGRLRLSIDYGTRRYRRATAEGWAAAILEELRLLLRHCLAAGAGAHTPSDFAMAGLDEQELARLAGLLGGGSGD